MRRVLWSRAGRHDFESILGYIAERNPIAAEGVASRLDGAILSLAELPTGRPGRVTGTYEKVLTGLPYIIAYALSVDPDGAAVLIVLRLIHADRAATHPWRSGLDARQVA
jgi:toxin ParE1/3/4